MKYDCLNCPAWCCAGYPEVDAFDADIRRLAKKHGIGFREAKKKFTETVEREIGGRVIKMTILRFADDPVYGKACMFLHRTRRICMVYDSRPKVCRKYPNSKTTCHYYNFLMGERQHQLDDKLVVIATLDGRET